MAQAPRPPRFADALLRRYLPAGTVGLSIIGDLHQEFDRHVDTGSVRFPRLWYVRSATALAMRYAVERRRTGTGAGLGMGSLLADVRFGGRMIRKSLLLSLTAVFTIGIGVGLTTQTFSMIHGSIMRGLPVDDPHQLMSVNQTRLELGIEVMELSLHDFLDVREQQTSFEDLAAFYQGTVNLAGDDGLPERFAGAFVTANALSHLGVRPQMGRVFRAGEDAPDASPMIVLAHHVWVNRFARDPGIVGKSLRINGQTTEVIGVMPEGFRFPFREDVWLTHRMDPRTLLRGGGDDLDVFGRLRPGVSVAAARAELQSIAARLEETFPELNAGIGLDLMRYDYRFMPRQVRAVLWLMLAATFGVLLIACANVANLLMAKATLRTREVAIRTAMGASRGRVLRQMLIESAMLAALGGLVGVGLGAWGVGMYNDFAAEIPRPYWIDPSLDAPVLLFVVVATAIAALAAGLVPALRASGVGLGEVLRDGSRGSSGLGTSRFSGALVVTEIAVSTTLLVAAGLMVQSILNQSRVDPGFSATGVMSGRIGLFEADYPTHESRDQFLTELRERLEAEPLVESAALGTHLPGLGSFLYLVEVEGETYPTDRDYPQARSVVVSENYFDAFDVGFASGRDFTPLETRVDGDLAAIVSESFVDRFVPGGEAVGRRVRIAGDRHPWMTIVGIVPDMEVGGGVGGLGNDQVRPERVFIPQGLYDHSFFSVILESSGPPETVAQRMREVVAELDPNLPIYDLAAVDVAIDEATWALTLFGIQFSAFGVLALFLAAVGLYGVMAFSVNQRRQEMGVRMALGAHPSSILRLVLRRGALQLAVGAAIGLSIGAFLVGPMRYALYGIDRASPLLFAAILLTLVAAGLAACLMPARAATRADPVEVMKAG